MGCRTEDDVPQDTYNYGIMTIRFDGGSMGYYEAGWANTCSSDNTKEIIGPKGRLKLIYQKDRLYNAEEGDLIEWYKYPEKEYVTINSPCDRKPADDQFLYLIRMIESRSDARSCPFVHENLLRGRPAGQARLSLMRWAGMWYVHSQAAARASQPNHAPGRATRGSGRVLLTTGARRAL